MATDMHGYSTPWPLRPLAKAHGSAWSTDHRVPVPPGFLNTRGAKLQLHVTGTDDSVQGWFVAWGRINAAAASGVTLLTVPTSGGAVNFHAYIEIVVLDYRRVYVTMIGFQTGTVPAPAIVTVQRPSSWITVYSNASTGISMVEAMYYPAQRNAGTDFPTSGG